MPVISMVPLLASFFLAGIVPAAAAESFAFWPGKGAKGATGFQSLQEHPCGEVAYAKVEKLPLVGSGPLLPELVVELNSNRQVVRRWPMPVDYMPEAVRGDELLVAFGASRYWVRPSGAFVRSAPVPAPDPKYIECNLKAIFGDSGYAQCNIFVDLASREERTIAYQGACT